MSYGIRITGLKEAQRLLGADLRPAIQAATKAIALEVQGEMEMEAALSGILRPELARMAEGGNGQHAAD